MDAMIHVGHTADTLDKLPKEIASAIETIFKSGYENRMDQATILAALKALTEVTSIPNTTITNSSFVKE